jgi:hypothetical protein
VCGCIADAPHPDRERIGHQPTVRIVLDRDILRAGEPKQLRFLRVAIAQTITSGTRKAA